MFVYVSFEATEAYEAKDGPYSHGTSVSWR